MSYFNFTKSNIIIENGESMVSLGIKNAESISELLDAIMLRDCFRIKGIGMLGIRTISIAESMSLIEFICYRIDTAEYY
jgi:hypothetical protein